MIIFAFKKTELKEKTQNANFSLPFKNLNSLLKNGFRIRIPKLVKNWADFRFRIRIANPNLNPNKKDIVHQPTKPQKII